MSKDETRKAILARRARFVAAAMVGLGMAACEKQGVPGACLKTAPVPTAKPEDAAAEPSSDASMSPDAGTAATDARPSDATGPADAGPPPDPGPMVCLSQLPPEPCLKVKPPPKPPPQPCLKVAPPTHNAP